MCLWGFEGERFGVVGSGLRVWSFRVWIQGWGLNNMRLDSGGASARTVNSSKVRVETRCHEGRSSSNPLPLGTPRRVSAAPHALVAGCANTSPIKSDSTISSVFTPSAATNFSQLIQEMYVGITDFVILSQDEFKGPEELDLLVTAPRFTHLASLICSCTCSNHDACSVSFPGTVLCVSSGFSEKALTTEASVLATPSTADENPPTPTIR